MRKKDPNWIPLRKFYNKDNLVTNLSVTSLSNSSVAHFFHHFIQIHSQALSYCHT